MRCSTSRRALVTGASSGIGAAFARLLSARGFDLVLVGRDRVRLESVAASLPRVAQVMVADLTQEAELVKIEAVLRDGRKPVDLLVNNAAMGRYGPVAEHDPDLLRARSLSTSRRWSGSAARPFPEWWRGDAAA